MFYYRLVNNILVSEKRYEQFEKITEQEAACNERRIFVLTSSVPEISRRSFCISDPDLISVSKEGLHLLSSTLQREEKLPDFILDAINCKRATMINTDYPNWQDVLYSKTPKKWRINVVGLGDVGSMLVTGLRLLGSDSISEIGIFDLDASKIKRWEFEANQIMDSTGILQHPPVHPITQDKLFDCDMFVFCVTAGVPPLHKSDGDVRIAQLETNSKIIREYAVNARKCSFKGVFSVVSDPVDFLCKAAFSSSNTDSSGRYDFCGLAPEQIRGYGLGVMHARAAYFAGLDPACTHYIKEGRSYGPHGEGLVIADSIENYNDMISKDLTEKTKTANLKLRELGFKPYVAPALSSGALSILASIKGQWHYSATFIGGVYFGARNRLLPSGVELERLPIPEKLFLRLENTYESLRNIL